MNQLKLCIAILFIINVIEAQVISRETKIFGYASNWVNYDNSCIGRGIYIDVDFSEENFKTVPMIFPTLTGTSGHWATTGVTSIYNLSTKGFRIYLRHST